MTTASEPDGTPGAALRRLHDVVRTCLALPGEAGEADLRAAIERTAIDLSGATAARVVLEGEAADSPAGTPPSAGEPCRAVPLSWGGHRVGVLEVAGLPKDPPAETRLFLDLLAGLAGLALANARLRARLAHEEPGRRHADGELRAAPDLREDAQQAEERLRERDRFLRRVADATPDLVYVFDLVARRNVYANRELTRGLGYTDGAFEALGPRLIGELIHPDDLPAVEAGIARVRTASDDDVVEYEYRLKDSSGAWRRLQSRDVVFARDPEGRPTQALGVAKDVTLHEETRLALARSERFYRTLVDALPGGVAIVDAGDRLTWASRRYLELFRARSEGDLLGTPILDLVAPESSASMAERRRRLREEGAPAEPAELHFTRLDGTTFWGVGSAAPLVEEDGRATGSVAFVFDASAKHRAEEKLRHRERFIERVFRASPDAMYVFDLEERRVVYSNRDLWSLGGYSREEAEARKGDFLTTLLHPDDLALYESRVARFDSASDDDVLETFFRIRHRDGAVRWLHGRSVVFDRSSEGRPVRVLAVVKDVTAQKEAEDSLRESEIFHRTLADTVPVGLAVTDADETITWSSPALRELLGVASEADVVGTRLAAWVAPGSESLVTERRRLPRAAQRPARTREVSLRRRDGTTFWADVVSAPLFDADGSFAGAIVAAQDATDLRNASLKLKVAADRLQHLSRRVVEVQEEERRHVARELHDEIGQSLAAIFFRMQALLNAPDPLPRGPLEESAEIADRTIHAVRDLSLDLHPSLLAEAGLADTLRWYIDRQVRGPGLAVELTTCPAVASLPADLRSACFRIAQSALTNVVRHAKARSVFVEVGTSDGELALVVRDDGVGFDPAAVLPRASSGTSLGILGMQERAELLGGTIAFESAPGRGTSVTARFPLPRTAGEDPA